MNTVYTVMEFKAGEVINPFHAKVCAKAFEHKSVKLIRIEALHGSFADIMVFKGGAWIAKRIVL